MAALSVMLQFNVLADADDLVVIAPSWRVMQTLLNLLHSQAVLVDMSCNVSKMKCMIFKPKRRNRIIRREFPLFKVGGSYLSIMKIVHKIHKRPK